MRSLLATWVHLSDCGTMLEKMISWMKPYGRMYLIDVTSQPLATAYLQILDPRKPLPPQTTSFLVTADVDMVAV